MFAYGLQTHAINRLHLYSTSQELRSPAHALVKTKQKCPLWWWIEDDGGGLKSMKTL